MCGTAIGTLKITVDAFYDLTPIEFRYAMKSVMERLLDEYKTQYEVARYLAKHIWNSAGKSLKGNGLSDVKDVGLFGWEVEEEVFTKKQSPETIKEAFLRLVGKKNVVNKNKVKEE